jgi:hypothetical protein
VLGAVLVLLSFGGCDFTSAPALCTDVALSGILVRVVDSTTAGPAFSDSVSAKVVDGSFVDSLRVASDLAAAFELPFAEERSGVYAVEVRAAGYDTWQLAGVAVTANECHVRPVHLTARLQRN